MPPEILAKFKVHDVDKDGLLTADQFQSGIEDLGVEVASLLFPEVGRP